MYKFSKLREQPDAVNSDPISICHSLEIEPIPCFFVCEAFGFPCGVFYPPMVVNLDEFSIDSRFPWRNSKGTGADNGLLL